jgi:hypothetical protein
VYMRWFDNSRTPLYITELLKSKHNPLATDAQALVASPPSTPFVIVSFQLLRSEFTRHNGASTKTVANIYFCKHLNRTLKMRVGVILCHERRIAA